MECPSCGLLNTDSARRCECGFDLTSDDAAEVRAGREMRRFRWRAAIGVALVLVGGFLAYREWDDWVFARAAAGLGFRGEAPLPLSLILCVTLTIGACVYAWRAVKKAF